MKVCDGSCHGEKVVLKESDEGLRVYSAHYYYMELTVAKMLHDLNVDFDVTPSVLEHRIHMIEEQAELALDDRQREAVMEAVRHGILIVTGGREPEKQRRSMQ